MPYQTIDDLSSDIQSMYNEDEQRAFIAAFNNVYEETGDERRAFSAGHTAAQGVNKMFTTDTGFKLVGDNKWIIWYANSFGPDRDGEFFTTQALAEDVQRKNKTGQFPDLWFFHIQGTKHATTKTVQMVGRFVIATGEFDDTPLARKLKAFYRDTDIELKASFGFTYDILKKQRNTYHHVDAFEISVLPADYASNVFTKIDMKGIEMPNDAQKKALATALGSPEEAEQIVAAAQEQTKAMEQAGVQYKSAQPDSVDDLQDRLVTATTQAINDGLQDVQQKMRDEIAQLRTEFEAFKMSMIKDDDEEDEEDKEYDKEKKKSIDETTRHRTERIVETALAGDQKQQSGVVTKSISELPYDQELYYRTHGNEAFKAFYGFEVKA